MKEQPTHQEKIDTLKGIKTGWDCAMRVPDAPHHFWTEEDWIKWIGDKWFRVKDYRFSFAWGEGENEIIWTITAPNMEEAHERGKQRAQMYPKAHGFLTEPKEE